MKIKPNDNAPFTYIRCSLDGKTNTVTVNYF